MGVFKVAWSPEMLEWLRENYKKYTYAESAAILNEKFGVNLTRSRVVTMAYAHGNPRNTEPENLVLLTRCELMKLVRQYGRDSVGDELKAKILLVKLDLKAKELMKK